MNILTITVPGIIILLSWTIAFAALPKTISYQGYLKDGAGKPVTAATSITFSLYSSNPARNNPVWRESQSVTPVNGVYSVQLGAVTPLNASFEVPYYLGMKAGADPELTPLQPLSSAPYALRSGTADNATSVSGQSLASLDSRYLDPTRPVPTAQQIATLRWDQVRGGFSAIPVGTNPTALAFDGSSLWVANGNSNNLMKINPVTGAVGAPIPVGAYPRALAFDGSSIWVANQNSNNVMKINPLTGAVGAPIHVGTSPFALAFDGRSIWVANYDSSSIQKINPATGAVGAAIPVVLHPFGLVFDGSSIWVSSYTTGSVQKINPVTGAVSPPLTVGAPAGMAFDGSSIWVGNFGDNSVMKINPATGAVGAPIAVGALPMALAFDGSSIWVANYGDNSVMKINPATGAVGAPVPVGTNPQGLAFDGSSIWVVNNGSGAVTRLTAAAEPVGVQTVGTEQINGAIAAAKLDLSTVVSKAGDTMTGVLNLPTDGLTVGSSQLVASGGKVGVGGQPVNPAVFQVFNATTSGQAALFQVSNPGNYLPSVYGATAGGGQAIFGLNTGTGSAGHFQISNPVNKGSALVAETNGIGFAGEFFGSVRVTGPLSSTVATGTAPFAVASTTQVNNLNAALVGGKSAGDFVLVDSSGGISANSLTLAAGGVTFPDGTVQTAAAAPTWHQILPAAQRFQLVMNNEAVLDRETGLVWQRSTVLPVDSLSWSDAISACYQKNIGGRRGWKLPTIEELASLGDPTQTNPALPVGHPFLNVQSSYYWSSTAYAGDPAGAWVVSFYNGYVAYYNKSNSLYVRCVRGGQ